MGKEMYRGVMQTTVTVPDGKKSVIMLTENFVTMLRKNVFVKLSSVVRWIKKGKSLDDILDFSSLPPDRVQQLFTETQK